MKSSDKILRRTYGTHTFDSIGSTPHYCWHRILHCFVCLVMMALPSRAYTTPTQDAVNQAAKAFYYQQHWDQDVNRFLKHYEDKLSPEEKKYGGYLAVIFKAVLDRQVHFVWTFP